MEVLSTLDQDCSALAGLFQIIVNDLKSSGPMWEDFLTKASKLQSALKTTLGVFSTFLDAFQKIADCATHTRGATKDVGAALTRLSMRQRAIESRIKTLTNSLLTCLVVPLQEKLEEWRKSQHLLDKEHTKEYKRVRLDIKKRTESVVRLQRKAKKGGKNAELNRLVQSTVDDLVTRYGVLEETERTALRHALKEERSRYCSFAHALQPVLEEEVGLVSELGHLREVMMQLEKHSADPHVLPAASEQVLEDVKTGESKWAWQTPPSSPTSSLGSRKSSVCSISSLNSSSSSSAQSPSHHHTRQRSVSQMMRMVSGSSQDSGFISQDTLHRPIRPMSIALPKGSGLSENSCSDGHPTPSPAGQNVATWPNILDGTLQHKSASSSGLHSIGDRPHTISSAYERGKERMPLTAYTFQPPPSESDGRSGACSPRVVSQPQSPYSYEIEDNGVRSVIGHLATISRRSSKTSLQFLPSTSQESLNNVNKAKPPLPFRCGSLERPTIPEKEASVKQKLQLIRSLQRQDSKKDSNSSSSNSVYMPDFHQTAPDMIVPQPVYSNMAELKNDFSTTRLNPEANESDGGSSHTSLGSSGYGSQSNMAHEAAGPKFEDCEVNPYCTLRPQSLVIPAVPPNQQIYAEGFSGSRTGSLRRGTKPPPPVRRSSTVSNGGTFHPPTRRREADQTGENGSFPTKMDRVNCYGSPPSQHSSTSSSSSSADSQSNISPLNRTDSESSTPVGSMESFPPPPAFLLEGRCNTQSNDDDSKTPQGESNYMTPSTQPSQECLQMRKISVSEAVKSLQEKQHQPPSPLTYRRNQSQGKLTGTSTLPNSDTNFRRPSLDSQRTAISSKFCEQNQSEYQRPVVNFRKPVVPLSKPLRQSAGHPPQSHNNFKGTSPRLQRAFGNEGQFNHAQGFYNGEETFKGKPIPNKMLSRSSSNPSSGRNSPILRHQSENQNSFIQNLNMVLAQRSPNPDGGGGSPKTSRKRQPEYSNGVVQSSNSSVVQRSGSNCSDKASKVRHWMSKKASSVTQEASTTGLKESLLDQIRKGTSLRRAKHVADRSAPRVY